MSEIAQSIKKIYLEAEPDVLEVPEWDRKVFVFPMTIGQLMEINTEPDLSRRAAKIVAIRCRDENNRRILDDEDFEAICSHGTGPYKPAVIARLSAELMALGSGGFSDSEGGSGN